MGFPQVCSSEAAEEVLTPSVNVVGQCSAQLSSFRTCPLGGTYGEHVRGKDDDKGYCERRNNLEISKFPDVEISAKVSQVNPRGGRNVHFPLSRIVGFESVGVTQGLQGIPIDTVNLRSEDHAKTNELDSSGLSVKKRLLSPLNLAFLSGEFGEDSLDISCSSSQTKTPALIDHKYSTAVPQDYKKVYVGAENQSTIPEMVLSTCLQSKSLLCGRTSSRSIFFTDGPLLEKRELLPCSGSVDAPPDGSSSRVRLRSGALSMSTEKRVSPPPPLSPLGPKSFERLGAVGCTNKKKNTDECYLALMNIEGFLCKSRRNGSIGPEEEDMVVGSRSFEDSNLLKEDFLPSSYDSISSISWPFCQESTPKSRCLARSLSGLSVRRSLVGSFEESLLSGRFLSGKPNQKINGFLAVLSITGGNFSPQSQKLPFCVDSVGGDCSLFYFSSIDLPGCSTPIKCSGQKSRRSLGCDQSQAIRSRLRVPMKGRIQLTFLRQKVTLKSPASPSAQSKPREGSNSNRPDKTESSPGINGNRSTQGEFSEKQGCLCDDIFQRTERKPSPNCSKANGNMSSAAGALRYALHLRFMCPFPKKGSRSINGKEVERRFYLYNDMRVVFPQQQSDSDEGKWQLKVEYHYPEDPKYFGIGN